MFTSNFGLSPLEMRLVYLFVFFPIYSQVVEKPLLVNNFQ